MSIAILPMSAEYGWNLTTVGLIQSSFFWGYLLTQVTFPYPPNFGCSLLVSAVSSVHSMF